MPAHVPVCSKISNCASPAHPFAGFCSPRACEYLLDSTVLTTCLKGQRSTEERTRHQVLGLVLGLPGVGPWANHQTASQFVKQGL